MFFGSPEKTDGVMEVNGLPASKLQVSQIKNEKREHELDYKALIFK